MRSTALAALLWLAAAGLCGCGNRGGSNTSRPAEEEPPPVKPTALARKSPGLPPPPNLPAATGPDAVARTVTAGIPATNATASAAGPASLGDTLARFQALNIEARVALVEQVADLADTDEKKVRATGILAEMAARETDEKVKLAIIDELERLEHPAVVGSLLRLLDSAQPETVRQSASDSLEYVLSEIATSRHPQAFATLITALDPRWPANIREAAIVAFEDLEDKRAIPVLEKLLNDPNEDVRVAAQDAIDLLKDL
jgi:uncharacterized protein (UPF0147 family)